MRGDLLSLVLVAPLVFRAPPVVSGRAARCARGRRLPTFVACCAAGVPGAGWAGRPRGWAASLRSSPRLEARPCPPVPPAPSTPAVLAVPTCGSARRLVARPGPAAHVHRSQARWFSRRLPHLWGLVCWRVVRRVVLVSGQALPPPTGTAARSRPRALRLGVAGEVARWFETAIAFACLCLCGIETVIAFAGEKWAFFGAVFGAQRCRRFQRPRVGACSCVVGFNIAMFLCPVREICRPAQPDVGASAKKFTLRRSWMQRGARGWRRWGFCTT